jgi:hypothetical protein
MADRAQVAWSHPDDEPALTVTQSVQGGPQQVIIVLPEEIPAFLADIRRVMRERAP